MPCTGNRFLSECNKAFGSSKDFISKFSDCSLEILKDKKECVNGDYPTLLTIERGYNRECLLFVLYAHLSNFQDKLTIDRKLNEEQLVALCDGIADNFGILKITEIMVFFRELLTGFQYEKFYGYIDPQTIARNLHIFMETTRVKMINQAEEERKQKVIDDSRKGVVTYEEYCRMKGKEVKPIKVSLPDLPYGKADTSDNEKAMYANVIARETNEKVATAMKKAFYARFSESYDDYVKRI